MLDLNLHLKIKYPLDLFGWMKKTNMTYVLLLHYRHLIKHGLIVW
jgi:hypothetical protein